LKICPGPETVTERKFWTLPLEHDLKSKKTSSLFATMKIWLKLRARVNYFLGWVNQENFTVTVYFTK
jgi:hypothetical protein